MGNFSDSKIQTVWENAKTVENYNPNEWRKDANDAWINRGEYGVQTNFGWEIDHIFPQSKGGSDDTRNLRATHWKNNKSKGDHYPEYTYTVTSEENKNVEKEGNTYVNDDKRKELAEIYAVNTAENVAFDIVKHLKKDDGKNWSDYICGATMAPKETLMRVYEVPENNHCWIYRKANSYGEAYEALKLLKDLGIQVSNIQQGQYVFAFRKLA